MLSTTGPDIQGALGCQQMCGDRLQDLWLFMPQGLLLNLLLNQLLNLKCVTLDHVDATNVSNALNRQVALHNIRLLCPPITTILINLYRCPTELFTDEDIILSLEGTTQGDPLAMAMYSLATIPLIKRLEACLQVWLRMTLLLLGK